MPPSTNVKYWKHFIPLESNPAAFSVLAYNLGLSTRLFFTDVISLEEPVTPHPVYAIILIFPTTPKYEQKKLAEEATREEYDGSGTEEPVMWFKQTINNACGLYGILHCVANGAVKSFIGA